jgi:hypothetical protein
MNNHLHPLSNDQTYKSPFLSPKEAAAYLNISASMLAKLRVYGGGPCFHKLGRRVTYTLQDLEQWVGSRRRRSTSDL